MSDLYLAHHGVEGQKWGVQNGPPYPLDKAGQLRLKQQKAISRYNKARSSKIKAERASVATGVVGTALMGLGFSGILGLPAAIIGTATAVTTGLVNAGLNFVEKSNAIKIGDLQRKIDKEENRTPKPLMEEDNV